MKTRFISFLLFLMATLQVHAVAPKKPTIMVVPGKQWCQSLGITMDGTSKGAPDYAKALLRSDVRDAIRAMNDVMASRDYPMVDLAEALDDLGNEDVFDLSATDMNDEYVKADDYDQVARVAQADIVVVLELTSRVIDGESVVKFSAEAKDAASAKSIGALRPGTRAGYTDMTTVINGIVEGEMDKFCERLSRHFDDIYDNGREGKVIFKISEGCPLNMMSQVEMDGETGSLKDAIDYWFSENALNGAYNVGTNSKVRCEFNQIRFPLTQVATSGFKKNGRETALDCEGFLKSNGLENFMSRFNLSCSFYQLGIGKCMVIISGM